MARLNHHARFGNTLRLVWQLYCRTSIAYPLGQQYNCCPNAPLVSPNRARRFSDGFAGPSFIFQNMFSIQNGYSSGLSKQNTRPNKVNQTATPDVQHGSPPAVDLRYYGRSGVKLRRGQFTDDRCLGRHKRGTFFARIAGQRQFGEF